MSTIYIAAAYNAEKNLWTSRHAGKDKDAQIQAVIDELCSKDAQIQAVIDELCSYDDYNTPESEILEKYGYAIQIAERECVSKIESSDSANCRVVATDYRQDEGEYDETAPRDLCTDKIDNLIAYLDNHDFDFWTFSADTEDEAVEKAENYFTNSCSCYQQGCEHCLGAVTYKIYA